MKKAVVTSRLVPGPTVCGVCGIEVDTSSLGFDFTTVPCGHDAKHLAILSVEERLFRIVQLDSSFGACDFDGNPRRSLVHARGEVWTGSEREAHEKASVLLVRASRWIAYEVEPCQ